MRSRLMVMALGVRDTLRFISFPGGMNERVAIQFFVGVEVRPGEPINLLDYPVEFRGRQATYLHLQRIGTVPDTDPITESRFCEYYIQTFYFVNILARVGKAEMTPFGPLFSFVLSFFGFGTRGKRIN